MVMQCAVMKFNDIRFKYPIGPIFGSNMRVYIYRVHVLHQIQRVRFEGPNKQCPWVRVNRLSVSLSFQKRPTRWGRCRNLHRVVLKKPNVLKTHPGPRNPSLNSVSIDTWCFSDVFFHTGRSLLDLVMAMRGTGTPNLRVAVDFAKKITYSKGMPLEREKEM